MKPNRRVLILLGLLLGVAAGGPPMAKAVVDPMQELRSIADVTCDTDAAPELIAPTNARSICVSVTTGTTCVRLGGIDGGGAEATTTSGSRVGFGTNCLPFACFDVKKLGCVAESSTVAVNVSYGAP